MRLILLEFQHGRDPIACRALIQDIQACCWFKQRWLGLKQIQIHWIRIATTSKKWTKSALCFQTFTHKTHIPSWYFKTVHLLLIVQLFAIPSRFAQTLQIYHDKPPKMWRIMLSNYCMGFVGFPNMFRPLSSALVQKRLTLSIWPFWMDRITKNTILYWLSKMTFPEKYQSPDNREPTTVPHVRIAGWLRVISQVVELNWNQHIHWSLIFGVGTCGWHRTKKYIYNKVNSNCPMKRSSIHTENGLSWLNFHELHGSP